MGNRAWEGAHGLEWELPSPPPFHSWTEPPSEALIARGGVALMEQPASALDEAERRRRVRRSAVLFALIAAAFYFGFIVMMLVRGAK